MGLFDFFKKKDTGPDPLTGLTLPNLKIGYLLDFDMKTWQVEASHYYDWGEGDRSWEWQLISHDETIYLERESDDEDAWSVNRKIPVSRLDPAVFDHIRQHQDPPDTIVYEQVTYFLEEMAGGHFFQNGKGPGKELLSWSYQDDSGKKFLSIEQWGDDDFEASVGIPVEEYQFINILPAGTLR